MDLIGIFIARLKQFGVIPFRTCPAAFYSLQHFFHMSAGIHKGVLLCQTFNSVIQPEMFGSHKLSVSEMSLVKTLCSTAG
jgi:hypothetical protein